MKVSLINHTPDAEALLIFTKHTRLDMDVKGFEWVKDKCEKNPGWMNAELNYIANTIPSSWEFVDYTFLIEGVTRGFTHQFVRNRNSSYAQQSMRVTNVGEFHYLTGPTIKDNLDAEQIYQETMEDIQASYAALIDIDVAIEDARGILPTNILTNIVVKRNLRTMAETVQSRSGGRTQDEHRDVVSLMAKRVISVHPWAEQFLYPSGKDYFNELEKGIDTWVQPEHKAAMRKIVDKMRASKPR